MPTSLIAPVIGSLATGLIGSAFGQGGKATQVNYQPQGFNAGGISATGTGDVTALPDRTGLVTNIGNLYGAEGDTLAGLRSTVAPGMNQLLQARLDQINNSATKAIGDLRQNLSSRRVLGSSFGNDTLSRANAEFSSQRDQAVADSFLKSLAINQQLTAQEFSARRAAFQTGLDELNLETQTGLAISGKANNILASNAQAQAQLDAKAQAGAGQFFGQLVQPVGKAIGTGASNLFSGGGGFNLFGGGGGFGAGGF